MVMLSWRVAGSEAGVADAGNEGIQRVTGTVGCIQERENCMRSRTYLAGHKGPIYSRKQASGNAPDRGYSALRADRICLERLCR